jgi:hypothetical protein
MCIAITESRKRKKKTKGNIGSLDPFHNQCLLIMNIYAFFPLSSLNNTPTKQTTETTSKLSISSFMRARYNFVTRVSNTLL